MEIADPKCPGCNLQGFEHIVVRGGKSPKPKFLVSTCVGCGHIHGVFPAPPEPLKMPQRNPAHIIQGE